MSKHIHNFFGQRKWIVLVLLIIIIILGVLVRFYKLGEAPKGFYIDEAGQGYSAYSILETGKDEFGKAFPIVFRSFTDFKTPLYVYLIVPLIPLFDLTSFTVRFPSFLFSILTIPLLFLLISELLSRQKNLNPHQKEMSNILGLLSALFLAISPWHTLFGRTNFECNVALFFYLLGIYLFYIGIKKPWVLIASGIIFAISLPAYHSERIITPLTVMLLGWRFRQLFFKKDSKHLKSLIIGGVLALIISIPTISVALTPGFLARASGLNIFSHERQLPSGFTIDYDGPLEGVINSSWFLSSKEFMSLYMSYFSPRNMFYLGDYGPRYSFPDLATFFVWQLPFYLFGLYLLLKMKNLGELRFITIMLLLITPIPAAVTRDPYTTIRALPLVIPQTILISLGVISAFNFLKSKLKIVFCFIVLALIIHSILNLYSSAIILNEFYRGVEWDYGLEEVSNFLKSKDQTIPAVFDNTRDEQYIQLAFFLKYNPAKFQQENFEVSPSEYYTNMKRNGSYHIGRITTRAINWQEDLKTDQYLIGDELAISYQQISEHKLKLEDEILYPDQSVAFRIVRTNPVFENSSNH